MTSPRVGECRPGAPAGVLPFPRYRCGRPLSRALAAAKRLAKGAAHAVGFDVVEWSGHTTLAAHLGTLFSLFEINCVVDVGAHRGEYGTMLRRDVGFRGSIASVEPVPENFEALSRRVARDPQWRAYPFALGDASGRLPIRVVASTLFSSFLAPSDYGAERFARDTALLRTVEVEVRRLEDAFDDLVSGVPDPRPYLKVDAQGYDMRVVEGAGRVLARFLALQVELPAKPIYREMTALPAAIERLDRLGFELTGAYPVSRDADGLRVVELDCVFVRRPGGSSA